MRGKLNPMAELTAKLAAEFGGGVALRDDFGETTWEELDDHTNRAVNALRALGLTTHDTLALMSGNRSEFFEVFAAAGHGGWTVVPVNWHWVADELAYVVENSGSLAVLVDERFVDVAVAARADDRTAGCRHWIILGRGEPAAIDGADMETPVGFLRWEDLLAQASPDEPADQAMGGPMFYTSGTTGFPKGVRSSLSSTGAPPAVLELISHAFTDMLGLPPAGSTLLIGPAYHSAQWVFSVFPLLRGSTVTMRHRFDAAEALELIDAHQTTNVHLVPTQMIRMCQLPEGRREAFDGSSLAVAFHGAAPCPEWVKREMLEWWGPVVSEYYGGTEGGFLSMISGDEWLEHPGSLGRSMDNMELRILDDDGQDRPAGTTGEIWFRSTMGSDFEYHGDAEKTDAAHRDGWGTLGDVGYLDADGFLFMSDRKIDMIISGGVNIYPAEIEAVLLDHVAVADVAVFGVPDDEMGESVAAAVELSPSVARSEELRVELTEHCQAHLAGYKRPKLIEFHDELPRTGTGKLLKRELRDPHWESAGRSI